MIKVNFITTWGTKCGIADYSEYLVNALKKCENLKISIVQIKKPNIHNPFYFIKLLNKVKKFEITHVQYQPSLFGYIPYIPIFINYFPIFIFFLKFWKKNRIITTVHEFVLNSVVDKINLKFLKLSDKIIVHNKNLADLLETNGVPQEKLSIIPHGTPKGQILDKKISKEKLGVSNKNVLTIFGFIHENKGHDLLIEALSNLNDNITLLIAGGARVKEHESFYNNLKERSHELKLKDRIKFLDYVKEEDLPIIFNATDIAIFPYRWIITSGSFHLTLSYKIPTITSDLNYFKEIKKEYDCLITFKKDNKEDLVEKITYLLNNKEKQTYLKENCENFYIQTRWESVAKKTLNLYLDHKID
ncbi:MAG: glycosyltransferase [Methanobacterium sp.]|uniref:glycosyltransferase n=1 Tax=Methanobacterium sp. TaxID=2164 RepID=UPI003D64D2DC|nr:glycosyltransferase [Methanobacterium sp.]